MGFIVSIFSFNDFRWKLLRNAYIKSQKEIQRVMLSRCSQQLKVFKPNYKVMQSLQILIKEINFTIVFIMIIRYFSMNWKEERRNQTISKIKISKGYEHCTYHYPSYAFRTYVIKCSWKTKSLPISYFLLTYFCVNESTSKLVTIYTRDGYKSCYFTYIFLHFITDLEI